MCVCVYMQICLCASMRVDMSLYHEGEIGHLTAQVTQNINPPLYILQTPSGSLHLLNIVLSFSIISLEEQKK